MMDEGRDLFADGALTTIEIAATTQHVSRAGQSRERRERKREEGRQMSVEERRETERKGLERDKREAARKTMNRERGKKERDQKRQGHSFTRLATTHTAHDIDDDRDAPGIKGVALPVAGHNLVLAKLLPLPSARGECGRSVREERDGREGKEGEEGDWET